MSANTSIVADNDFGPGIEGFRGGLDFTLVFEDAFLGLVPSALLLIAAPIRTLWLWNASKKVTEDAIRLNKVVRSLVVDVEQIPQSDECRPSWQVLPSSNSHCSFYGL